MRPSCDDHDPGVADQDVERPVPLRRRTGAPSRGREVELAHVRGAGDPGCRLRAPVGVADREHHVRTGAGGPRAARGRPRVGTGHREGAACLVAQGRGVSAHDLQRTQRAVLTGGGDVRMDHARAATALATDRPQVVAHRGSSDVAAEHTLGAYRAALDEGADALECDVRLTADGHLVCVHDRDLRRTAQQHRRASPRWSSPSSRSSTSPRGRTPGPTSTTRHPTATPSSAGAHPAPAARDRGRTYGRAGRAGDRDQAPDPVRRPGRAPAGASCSTTFGWAGAGRPRSG